MHLDQEIGRWCYSQNRELIDTVDSICKLCTVDLVVVVQVSDKFHTFAVNP